MRRDLATNLVIPEDGVGIPKQGELSRAIDAAMFENRKATVSEAERANILSETLPGASGYLTAMPSHAMKLTMTPDEFTTEVGARLCIPVKEADTWCPLCDCTFDRYGWHAGLCMCGGDIA